MKLNMEHGDNIPTNNGAAIVRESENLLKRVLILEIIGEGPRREMSTASFVPVETFEDSSQLQRLSQCHVELSRLLNQYDANPASFKDVNRMTQSAKQLRRLLDINYQRAFIEHNSLTGRVGSTLSMTPAQREYRTRLLAPLRVSPKDVSIDRKTLLGRGGFGEVYAGRYKYRGSDVALKVLRARHRDKYDDVLTELAMMQLVGHDYRIISLIGFVELEGRLCIMTERAEYGSVKDLLYNPQNTISIATRVQWMWNLESALKHLHGHHFVHRDIKPANIFVMDNKTAKLGDFGLVRSLQSDAWIAGTVVYMAPEVRARETVGSVESDLYSFGVTVAEVMTGLKPEEDESQKQSMMEEAVRNLEAALKPALSEAERERTRETIRRLPHLLFRPDERIQGFGMMEEMYGRFVSSADYIDWRHRPHPQFEHANAAVQRSTARVNVQSKKLYSLNSALTRFVCDAKDGRVAIFDENTIDVVDLESGRIIAHVQFPPVERLHCLKYCGANTFIGVTEKRSSRDDESSRFGVWRIRRPFSRAAIKARVVAAVKAEDTAALDTAHIHGADTLVEIAQTAQSSPSLADAAAPSTTADCACNSTLPPLPPPQQSPPFPSSSSSFVFDLLYFMEDRELRSIPPSKLIHIVGDGFVHTRTRLFKVTDPVRLSKEVPGFEVGKAAVTFADGLIAVRSFDFDKLVIYNSNLRPLMSPHLFPSGIRTLSVLSDNLRLIIGFGPVVSVVRFNRDKNELEVCWDKAIRQGIGVRQIVVLGNDTIVVCLEDDQMFVLRDSNGAELRPLFLPTTNLAPLRRLSPSSPWVVTKNLSFAWHTETDVFVPLYIDCDDYRVTFLDDGRVVTLSSDCQDVLVIDLLDQLSTIPMPTAASSDTWTCCIS